MGPVLMDRSGVRLMSSIISVSSQQILFIGRWEGTEHKRDLAQHYLTHLLREKLVESKSRIVVVSSGAIRQVSDPGELFSIRPHTT